MWLVDTGIRGLLKTKNLLSSLKFNIINQKKSKK